MITLDGQVHEVTDGCLVRLFPDTRAQTKYRDPLAEGTWSQEDDFIKLEWDAKTEEPLEDDYQDEVWRVLCDGFKHMPLPKESVTDIEIECRRWVCVSRDEKTHLVFDYKKC